MKHLARIRAAGLTLAAVTSLFTACAVGPVPHDWSDSTWNQNTQDVENVVMSLLTMRFQFGVESIEEDKQKRTFRLRTGWNYSGADGAVMAGMGVRRMAFVNIEEIYVDDDRVLPLPGSESDKGAAKEDDKGPRPRVVIRNGRHMLAKTRVAVAVLRERNMNMSAPGAREKGDWQDDGSDEGMTAEIMEQIRSRLSGASAKGLELSSQTREALEKYWKDEYLTPEEREKRLRDLHMPEKPKER